MGMVISMKKNNNIIMSVLATLLCSCLLIASSISTEANENNQESKKNILREKGCSDEVINRLPAEVIDRIISNINRFDSDDMTIDVRRFIAEERVQPPLQWWLYHVLRN